MKSLSDKVFKYTPIKFNCRRYRKRRYLNNTSNFSNIWYKILIRSSKTISKNQTTKNKQIRPAKNKKVNTTIWSIKIAYPNLLGMKPIITRTLLINILNLLVKMTKRESKHPRCIASSLSSLKMIILASSKIKGTFSSNPKNKLLSILVIPWLTMHNKSKL